VELRPLATPGTSRVCNRDSLPFTLGRSRVKIILFNWYIGGVVQFGRLGTTSPDDYDDGEFGGMMIGRKNRSTLRKPAPVLLCPPQTPHPARTRTRAAAVGSQGLIA
jgi:hypothetical protein